MALEFGCRIGFPKRRVHEIRKEAIPRKLLLFLWQIKFSIMSQLQEPEAGAALVEHARDAMILLLSTVASVNAAKMRRTSNVKLCLALLFMLSDSSQR